MWKNQYKTWLFDCDGVLLDSNKLKSEAFYSVALPYGEKVAREFVEYHQKYGGVSRFEKMDTLWAEILGFPRDQNEINKLLDQYASICREKMLQCDETPGLRDFLDTIDESACMVVSGGKETELCDIFQKRGLSHYFDVIAGCPRTKVEILKDINIQQPAIFVGDSKYDYESAIAMNLDFLFLYQFTEFQGWREYFRNRDISIAENLRCYMVNPILSQRDENLNA